MNLESLIVPYQKFVRVDEILARHGILHSQTIFCLIEESVKTECQEKGESGYGEKHIQHALLIETWAFKICLLIERWMLVLLLLFISDL